MHKQTIALVDDDRNILTSLSIALEKEGFKVQTYIDGESALIGLTRTPPDLAVIDIKMPKMDGEELLKKLRKKTSMPVIFLTSKDDEVDELLGLKLGADDFIKKSGGFSIKVLISCFDKTTGKAFSRFGRFIEEVMFFFKIEKYAYFIADKKTIIELEALLLSFSATYIFTSSSVICSGCFLINSKNFLFKSRYLCLV